jgi:hypothetical protein
VGIEKTIQFKLAKLSPDVNVWFASYRNIVCNYPVELSVIRELQYCRDLVEEGVASIVIHDLVGENID